MTTLGLSPQTFAAGLMLVSALTHALIGALMKRSHDKLIFRACLGAICAAVMLPIALYLPLPPKPVWAILAASVCVHWVYQLSQAAAFTRGDMSMVYPIMRGSAPALTAIIAFFLLNETLTGLEIIGLSCVVMAIIGFGWPENIKPSGWGRAVIFALVCGALTALYTVIDAKGMRLAPIKLSFVAWLFVIDGLGMPLLVTALHKRRVIELARRDIRGGVAGAGLTLISFTAALYALSIGPVAKMSAIRETSVVFGAVIAAVWLKESFGRRRLGLALWLAFGLILMHMA